MKIFAILRIVAVLLISLFLSAAHHHHHHLVVNNIVEAICEQKFDSTNNLSPKIVTIPPLTDDTAKIAACIAEGGYSVTGYLVPSSSSSSSSPVTPTTNQIMIFTNASGSKISISNFAFQPDFSLAPPTADAPPLIPTSASQRYIDPTTRSCIVFEDEFSSPSIKIENNEFRFLPPNPSENYWHLSHFIYAPNIKIDVEKTNEDDLSVVISKNTFVVSARSLPWRNFYWGFYFQMSWILMEFISQPNLNSITSNKKKIVSVLVEKNVVNYNLNPISVCFYLSLQNNYFSLAKLFSNDYIDLHVKVINENDFTIHFENSEFPWFQINPNETHNYLRDFVVSHVRVESRNGRVDLLGEGNIMKGIQKNVTSFPVHFFNISSWQRWSDSSPGVADKTQFPDGSNIVVRKNEATLSHTGGGLMRVMFLNVNDFWHQTNPALVTFTQCYRYDYIVAYANNIEFDIQCGWEYSNKTLCSSEFFAFQASLGAHNEITNIIDNWLYGTTTPPAQSGEKHVDFSIQKILLFNNDIKMTVFDKFFEFYWKWGLPGENKKLYSPPTRRLGSSGIRVLNYDPMALVFSFTMKTASEENKKFLNSLTETSYLPGVEIRGNRIEVKIKGEFANFLVVYTGTQPWKRAWNTLRGGIVRMRVPTVLVVDNDISCPDIRGSWSRAMVLEFETGYSIPIEVVNISGNNFDVHVRGLRSDATSSFFLSSLWNMSHVKRFVINNNVHTGELLSVSFSMSYCVLFQTAPYFASAIITQRLEFQNNFANVQGSSAGPFFSGGYYSSSKLTIQKIPMDEYSSEYYKDISSSGSSSSSVGLIEKNAKILLKKLAIDVYDSSPGLFFINNSMQVTNIPGGTKTVAEGEFGGGQVQFEIDIAPATASPRAFMFRSFGVKIFNDFSSSTSSSSTSSSSTSTTTNVKNNDDNVKAQILFSGNTQIFTGTFAPMFVQPCIPLLPGAPCTKAEPLISSSSMAVAIFAVRNLLQTDSGTNILLKQNVVKVSTVIIKQNDPSIFAGQFVVDLSSTFNISGGNLIIDSCDTFLEVLPDTKVSPGFDVDTFNSTSLRATTLVFMLIGEKVPPETELSVSVYGGGEIRVNNCRVFTNLGYAALASTCRDAPSAEPQTDSGQGGDIAQFGLRNIPFDVLVGEFNKIINNGDAKLCVIAPGAMVDITAIKYHLPRFYITNSSTNISSPVRNDLGAKFNKYSYSVSKRSSYIDAIMKARNFQQPTAMLMNLAHKTLSSTTNVVLSHLVAESRLLLQREVKQVDIQQGFFKMLCLNVNTTEAFNQVCRLGARACSMPNCAGTISRSLTKQPTPTITRKPQCDPSMSIIPDYLLLNSASSSENKNSNNNKHKYSARHLATGNEITIQFSLISNLQMFGSSLLSVNFDSLFYQPKQQNDIVLFSKQISLKAKNKNFERISGFHLVSVNRSGISHIDVKFFVDPEEFDEYSTDSVLQICLPEKLFRCDFFAENDDDDDTDNEPVAGEDSEKENEKLSQNNINNNKNNLQKNIIRDDKGNLLFCSNPSAEFPRRWSSVAPEATAAAKGIANAAAIIAPTILSTVFSRPASLSSGIALQRQRFVLSVMECESSTNAPLNFLSSPLRMSVGSSSSSESGGSSSSEGKYLRGAAVGNTILFGVLLLLGIIFVMNQGNNYRNEQFRKSQHEKLGILNKKKNKKKINSSSSENSNVHDNTSNSNRNINRGKHSSSQESGNNESDSDDDNEEDKNNKKLSLFHPRFQAEMRFPTQLFLVVVLTLQGTTQGAIGIVAALSSKKEVSGSDVFICLLALSFPFILLVVILCRLIFPKNKLAENVSAKSISPPKIITVGGIFEIIKSIWNFLVQDLVLWKSRNWNPYYHQDTETILEGNMNNNKKFQQQQQQQQQRSSSSSSASRNSKRNSKNSHDERGNNLHNEQQEEEISSATTQLKKKQRRPPFLYAVERFGDSFATTRPEMFYYTMLNDVFFSFLLGLLAGISPDPGTPACVAVQFTSTIIICAAFLLATTFPLFSHLENSFLFVTNFCTLLAVSLVLGASTIPQINIEQRENLFEAAETIDAIVTWLCVFKFFADVVLLILDVRKEGKNSKCRNSWMRKFLRKHLPSVFKEGGGKKKSSSRNSSNSNNLSPLMNNNSNNNSSDKKSKRRGNLNQQQQEEELDEEEGIPLSLDELEDENSGRGKRRRDKKTKQQLLREKRGQWENETDEEFFARKRLELEEEMELNAASRRKDRILSPVESAAAASRTAPELRTLTHRANVQLSNMIRSPLDSNSVDDLNESRSSSSYSSSSRGKSTQQPKKQTQQMNNNNKHRSSSSSQNRNVDNARSNSCDTTRLQKGEDGKVTAVPRGHNRYQML